MGPDDLIASGQSGSRSPGEMRASDEFLPPWISESHVSGAPVLLPEASQHFIIWCLSSTSAIHTLVHRMRTLWRGRRYVPFDDYLSYV